MNDYLSVHHLSLCAGIGGIDVGLKRVVRSLRTVAYVEIEAFCCHHLVSQMEAGNLDQAPIHTDLHGFPWSQYSNLVDIVSGGFPCQPFSHAGKRAGVDDPRHLWPIILEGIRTVRPAIAFFENVDGIATAKSPGYESVLHHVLCDLEEVGYRTTAGCFSASEVGAPHLRKRWFILGVADAHSWRSKPSTLETGSSMVETEKGRKESSGSGQLADADRDSCGSREPRRASGELSEESEGLRGRSNQRQAGEESGSSGELADSNSRRQQEFSSTHHKDGSDERRDDSSGCGENLADSIFEGLEGHSWDGHNTGRQTWSSTEGGPAPPCGICRGTWRQSLFASECKGFPDSAWCPCGIDYCICPAPGPTQDGFEYVESEGVLWARPEQEWPAAPGQQQYDWEPPRVTQPGLGRDIDGHANGRVDRLRALGNSVVPAVAARAFASLFKELMK